MADAEKGLKRRVREMEAEIEKARKESLDGKNDAEKAKTESEQVRKPSLCPSRMWPRTGRQKILRLTFQRGWIRSSRPSRRFGAYSPPFYNKNRSITLNPKP
jgi:hypothetical protein